ncbi:MAG: cytochrome c biogenesis protein CcdA [Reichenbachiella sp.]|uniref:protein-disulfide reductase DsbD family protein n=3 Tax=Reichenbachiella sp. TaxID=2184521 RepID=UPI003265C35B
MRELNKILLIILLTVSGGLATVQAQSSNLEDGIVKESQVGTVEQELYGLTSISDVIGDDCNGSEPEEKQSKTLVGIFILGMIGGLLALLTPCVFPLIPLTVSFFTKGSENKKKGFRDAMLYGLFIFGVYVLLSIPFHLLDSINPDILNEISTNVWLNLSFFVIFLFFAFSFFGYYEITMPSSLTNKISAAEGVGGILGIFFMALTLSLVSFSCTGPILGSLLAGALSSDGGAWQLTAGMSGFGLALALPFALFAMFPSWMNKIPKSGGWLNSVKVVLGFVELALAFKFLSNADLVMHWGILKYELFMVLWIVVGVGLSLYFFGIVYFKHDSKPNNLSGLRIGLGVISAVFTIYLAMGLLKNEETNTFTSLKLLSGLAPPVGYSWIYPNDCPNDINCFKDLETGLAYAKKQNKPVLLDFTGYACVNCRKMEEHVWSNQKIFDYINDDFVLISLYVDDKKELPEEERVQIERVQGGKRKLRKYGHKWAHFQTKFFNTNSQPYYVLLSPDGKQMLNTAVGYTPNVDEYAEFLECGLNSFKNL